MEILQSTQKRCAFLGIRATSSDSLNRPFNARNTMFSIMFCTHIASCFLYLVYEAQTFGEFLNCGFILLAVVSGSLGFITIVYKLVILSKFINDLGEIVNKSERHINKFYQSK